MKNLKKNVCSIKNIIFDKFYYILCIPRFNFLLYIHNIIFLAFCDYNNQYSCIFRTWNLFSNNTTILIMRTFIAFFLLLLSIQLFAQKQHKPKFGKLDISVLKENHQSIDSSASAIVLADYGRSYFQYSQSEGFIFYFERYKLVKILDKEGYEYADVEIPVYHSNNGKESASSLKGYTYNLENGKLVKSKLEKSSVFREKYNTNWDIQKFTMPDVKESSVIEYQYKIVSPFTFNLRTWEFQSEIPTVYSQYEVTIPEYYDYQQISSGYHSFAVFDKSTISSKFTITTKDRVDGRSTTFDHNSIDYRENRYLWVAKDVPAFKKEAYLNNATNYISKIEFELRGRKFPNKAYEPVMGDWTNLNKTFMESQYFGLAIKQSGFLKQDLEKFENLEDSEKISNTLAMLKKEMEWNGNSRKYTTTTLKKAWDKKSGSSADINLMLVAALRRLDIDADPVLLSTRNHGIVRDYLAMSKQFNYVICRVRSGDATYLLDATDKYVPSGVLPVRCLNGQGRVISDSSPGWVNLMSTKSSENLFFCQLELSEDGAMQGQIRLTSKGYAAYNNRKKYIQKGEEKFMDEVKEGNKMWEISSSGFKGESEMNKPFSQNYEVEINDVVESAGNLLFINPLLTEGMKENPFKLEKRTYPVDFAYPIKESYMISITLPEGYVVDDLPKPVNIALPDNAGKFQFVAQQVGNKLSITNIYTINKAIFLPDEYPALKKFYNTIVSKHAEQIVLKKM